MFFFSWRARLAAALHAARDEVAGPRDGTRRGQACEHANVWRRRELSKTLRAARSRRALPEPKCPREKKKLKCGAWQGSSLLFAQRAMKVQIHATVNMEVDYKALSLQLQVPDRRPAPFRVSGASGCHPAL